MRIVRCALLLLAVLSLSGCIPMFLHAGYTAKDVIFESRLIGTWIQVSASGNPMLGIDTLSLRRDGEQAYRVTFRNGGDPDSFVFLGHLFRSGSATLLDLEPHPTGVVSAFYLPAHTFWRADLSGDSLFWGGLDESWVVAAAKRAGIGCPVDTVQWQGDPNVALTCGTPMVRRLLAAAAADPEAFPRGTLVRLGADARR